VSQTDGQTKTRSRRERIPMAPDLTDFGGGVTPPDEPHLQKRRKVHHRVGEKRIVAGWVGPCPERQCRGYVSERDSDTHRIHALDAYGISEGVLRRLGSWGVGRVFIVEDSQRVYEFTMRAWKNASQVPDRYLMREDDPQRYIERIDARQTWEHGDRFYLPRDADVDMEDFDG
jgi:hypothetical protein